MTNNLTDIAIIGIAGKYPKANSADELWYNIIHQKDMSTSGQSQITNPGYVDRYFALEKPGFFDNKFFGFTPLEATLTDPQHRILLTTVYKALLDAGYLNEPPHLKFGVFVTKSISTYLLNLLMRSEYYKNNEISYPILIGNDKDFLATKIAYKFNLTGPALTVQCACSSSLVATHYACHSLLNGECDLTIVGGVSVSIPQEQGYFYKEGGILSSDGRCRPFDEKRSGTIKGNGCSVLILKRLEDAVKDKDRIYALIKGTAINNDGSNKVGFTAPSILAQSSVIQEALAISDLTPHDIDYIETHGTGTKLGDLIELAALNKVFEKSTKKIPLGSLKANIGHLDVAAGISSVIKLIYVLNTGIVPPICHFRKINPELLEFSTPFNFPTEKVTRKIAHCSVSSFGMGGTNAHAIISRYERSESCSVIPKAAEKLDFRPSESLVVGRSQLACISNTGDAAIAPTARALASVQNQGFSCFGYKPRIPSEPLEEKEFWVNVLAEPDQKGLKLLPNTENRRNFIEEIIEIWIKAIGETSIKEDSHYLKLGGDSLTALEIIENINKRFQVSLNLSSFQEYLTPMKLAEWIETQILPQRPSSFIQIRKSTNSARTVFLIHPAGGTTFCYHYMNQYLKGDYTIFVIDLPDEYSQYDSMEQLAAGYLQEIRKNQPHGPYILGGYSFGGNLAYEIAVQFLHLNQQVAKIFLFDSHLPEAYYLVPKNEINYQEAFSNIVSFFDQKTQISSDALNFFYNKWMFSHQLLKRHRQVKQLSSDLVLFIPEEIENEKILDDLGIDNLNKEAWKDRFNGMFRKISVTGNHYTMFNVDHVVHLSRCFDEEMV